MGARAAGGLVALAVVAWAIAASGGPAEDVGARAHGHVVVLASGPRLAGTPAERRAAEYVAGHLRALGYRVELSAFPFPYFEAREVTLEVASPVRLRLSPRVLWFSPPTEGVLAARLVVAGRGLPEDFQGVDAQDAVALVERGAVPFLDKVENAARAGARAVVVYNHEPGTFTGTLTRRTSVPAVGLSREEGLRLRELARRGPVVVSLRVDTVVDVRTSWNVVGSLLGRGGRAVLGAHLDSVEGSPGANDNASGLAVALEAARLLRVRPPGWTVEVVGFGAEEGGLFGSAAYAGSDRARGVGAMLNLDMVGVGPRLVVGNTDPDRRVVDAVALVAKRVGEEVEVRRVGSSDHVSFERAGVPAAMLHRPDDPHYHTPEDTPDKVRPELLEPVVRLAAEALRHPALLVGAPQPSRWEAFRPPGRL